MNIKLFAEQFRHEDVIFSVSRSPFIAKKYGHLLGESQGEEGDCDQDGGDTQVGPCASCSCTLTSVLCRPGPSTRQSRTPHCSSSGGGN